MADKVERLFIRRGTTSGKTSTSAIRRVLASLLPVPNANVVVLRFLTG